MPWLYLSCIFPQYPIHLIEMPPNNLHTVNVVNFFVISFQGPQQALRTTSAVVHNLEEPMNIIQELQY